MRLVGAFLLIAVVAVVLVGLFIREANIAEIRSETLRRDRERIAANLTDFYRERRSWEGVRARVDGFLRINVPANDQIGARPDVPGSPAKPPPPTGAAVPAVADANRIVLLPVGEYEYGEEVPQSVLDQYGTAVVVDGQTVGWVMLFPVRNSLGPEEALYLERTNRALWLGSFGGVLVALMVGLFLAQKITEPLRTLTAATRRLAAGDLDQRVAVKTHDEIGELATAFNQMSQDLALQVRLRQQMTADIAHDLRTPLTTIAGYVEAMRDGDLEPTPERLELVATEIEHLHQMVADLRLLSQADAGELRLNLQPIRPAVLIGRAAAAHEHKAAQRGVGLRVDVRASSSQVAVDEARIARVFDNLVDNAIQHTPVGGEIVISAAPADQGIAFAVRDTGAGIAEEDLPHVFDRFYRADKARGDSGHSGLGLAIVRALVEAHGGSVRATSRLGQGTEFAAVLPAVATAD